MKKILGYLLLLMPFSIITFCVITMLGWKAFFIIFGIATFIFLAIYYGVSLIVDNP